MLSCCVFNLTQRENIFEMGASLITLIRKIVFNKLIPYPCPRNFPKNAHELLLTLNNYIMGRIKTPDYSHLYVTDFEIETGHVAGKILESEPIRLEYHYEQVFIAAGANDCVFNSEGFCIPDADLDTACQAAYGNGLLGAS